MKLIIGLGNPGKKYEHTRHNIGFRVLDGLAEKYEASFIPEERFKLLASAFDAEKNRVILAKPQTFMNASGEAALLVKNFYKIKNSGILAVHDDIDLPLGEMRLSADSGSAGHQGAASIIESVGKDVSRLRIGIENRSEYRVPETDVYVLQNFTKDEQQILKETIIPKAIEEIKKFIR